MTGSAPRRPIASQGDIVALDISRTPAVHFADWCAAHGFISGPAAPATAGACLASLADSHAPTTIRRRLSTLGRMHRFNDLPWNPVHRDIQGPLLGFLRTHSRPVQKAAAMTCPCCANGWRPAT